jgi:hypothetical protein
VLQGRADHDLAAAGATHQELEGHVDRLGDDAVGDEQPLAGGDVGAQRELSLLGTPGPPLLALKTVVVRW